MAAEANQSLPATTPGGTVAQLIKDNHKAIGSVLPKHMDANRMARIALVECRKNTDLLTCDPASLIGSILTAAKLGLEPGIQGQCYLIPRKINNRMQAELQIGYRGMMDLARRSRDVGSISAEVVYENDQFSYRLGTDPYIHHVPAQNDRGQITYFYAVAHLVASHDWQFRVMTKADVDAVRDRHSPSASKGFSPWKSHYEEMAKKTVIRALCKYLPTSVEVQRAVSLDEHADAGIAQNNAAELPPDFTVIPQGTSNDGGDDA